MFAARHRCVATAVFFPIAHELNDLGHVRGEHGQAAKDEEDHEEAAQGRLGVDVTIADGGHCHHQEVDALPVGQLKAQVQAIIQKSTPKTRPKGK